MMCLNHEFWIVGKLKTLLAVLTLCGCFIESHQQITDRPYSVQHVCPSAQVIRTLYRCQKAGGGWQDCFRYTCCRGFVFVFGRCILRSADPCSHSGCEQGCRVLAAQTICTCHPGYHFDFFRYKRNQSPYCNDIDECSNTNNGGCSQVCLNTQGAYHCACVQGYKLHTDNATCIPNLPPSTTTQPPEIETTSLTDVNPAVTPTDHDENMTEEAGSFTAEPAVTVPHEQLSDGRHRLYKSGTRSSYLRARRLPQKGRDTNSCRIPCQTLQALVGKIILLDRRISYLEEERLESRK